MESDGARVERDAREKPLDQVIYDLLVERGQLPKSCRDFTVVVEFQKPLRVIVDYFPEPITQGAKAWVGSKTTNDDCEKP